ncbi:helix-turn-helix transcriptional regulator [Brevibacillus ginsengisoli]|uniref:helix-turn-helix transcriptional regulator n=1 Tax=Brevibacillus ginsengisoli TaxID=363854 RepID=UPI003CF4EAA6
MDVKTIILGFLNYGEMSGYDIKQAFSNHIGFFYDASYGAIYPALRKMEQEGYVTKREIVQSGKPNKILYNITEEGKQLFLTEINTPIQLPMLRSDLLVKIFFGSLRSKDELETLFDNSITFEKQHFEQMEKRFTEQGEGLDDYQRMCWELSLHLIDSTRDFMETNRDRILNGLHASVN